MAPHSVPHILPALCDAIDPSGDPRRLGRPPDASSSQPAYSLSHSENKSLILVGVTKKAFPRRPKACLKWLFPAVLYGISISLGLAMHHFIPAI